MHDLRREEVYDFLMRLAISGCIAAAAAGPPCNTFSRLRMIRPGPPQLRDEAHP